MTILFISDLHLEPDAPYPLELLQQLLDYAIKHVEKLYILGDLFERWMGDDDVTAFSTRVIEIFKQATLAGLPIYFMHGNRDFLIGQRFAAQTGIVLIGDPTFISLYGQPTLLMHGDSLCTLDQAFQAWRKWYANDKYRKRAMLIPLFLRHWIGEWLRQKSGEHQAHLDCKITDVALEEVSRVMQQHNATQLIHGHTHRPATHSVILSNGQTGKRYVLGAWDNKPMILLCDQIGCSLKDLSQCMV